METIYYVQPLLQMLASDLNCSWTVFGGLLLQESGGDPNAIGDDGQAYGIAQIHAATKDNHRFALMWDMEKLLDPIASAAVLIAEMRRLRGWLMVNWGLNYASPDWLLLCWNWGAGNVKRHIEDGGTLDDLPERVAYHLELYREKGKVFE